MRLLKERVHLNLARLKKAGEVFEVDIEPDLAIKFKKGVPGISINEVLKAERIFVNAQKGLAASDERLKQVFGTDDPVEVAQIIIKEGEIQLTGEYREELRDAKRRRVIAIIHRNAIDPRTKLPHPLGRIEDAMVEAKVRIDEHKNAEEQVQDVLAALRRVLPITFAVKELWVRIPAHYAHKSQGIMRTMATIKKENWEADGTWTGTIEIPGGMQEDFFDKMNSITKGTVDIKILNEGI